MTLGGKEYAAKLEAAKREALEHIAETLADRATGGTGKDSLGARATGNKSARLERLLADNADVNRAIEQSLPDSLRDKLISDTIPKEVDISFEEFGEVVARLVPEAAAVVAAVAEALGITLTGGAAAVVAAGVAMGLKAWAEKFAGQALPEAKWRELTLDPGYRESSFSFRCSPAEGGDFGQDHSGTSGGTRTQSRTGGGFFKRPSL